MFRFGELGSQKEANELSPHRIKIETKFIDIFLHWTKGISITLSQEGIYYNWGKCGEEIHNIIDAWFVSKFRVVQAINFIGSCQLFHYFLGLSKRLNSVIQYFHTIPTLAIISISGCFSFSACIEMHAPQKWLTLINNL